jgi:formylmethanofuran dehydrogenase subunit C
MKLKNFVDDAYGGKANAGRLRTRSKDIVFSLDDLASRVGQKPSREEVEALVFTDERILDRLLESSPIEEHRVIWGILSSIAADRSPLPLHLSPGKSPIDYAGLSMHKGTIIIDRAGDHVGEMMTGGRIFILGAAGDYLGQGMSGGGIVSHSCKDYAFRNMKGGWGVIKGDAGSCLGLGNSGGKILVKGSSGERAGWLMHGGKLRIQKDAGDYLGILMSGGCIIVSGRTGNRAGWRKKGGTISAGSYGQEAAVDLLRLG